MNSAEFWPLFDQWRPVVFQDTLFFNAREVRTQHEIDQFPFLKAGMQGRYELHLVIFEGEELVGWSSSYQMSAGELYMMNSAILPKYRRQGHYKRLMQKVIERAGEMGFQQITSQHLTSNNDVIIPKLQAGFNIVGMEVSDQYGVFVKLAHYLNAARKDVYQFRTGAKRMTTEIEAIFQQTLPK